MLANYKVHRNKKKISDNDRKKETEIEEGRVCGGDQPA